MSVRNDAWVNFYDKRRDPLAEMMARHHSFRCQYVNLRLEIRTRVVMIPTSAANA